MSPASPLQRAKRQATGLLVVVVVVFVGTHFLPDALWVRCVQATSEAAMVGALADWFAVTALFRRIPLPIVGRHTAIIPRNKDRIGENLATFVRDKFLDAPSLIALMRRNDPAQWVVQWLQAPGNAQLLGAQLARLVGAALEMVQDRQVQRWLTRTLRGLISKMDMTQSMAAVLSALTHDGRHHAVLDDVLASISSALQRSQTRDFIAETIVQWLKREHPLKEKVLPTDWLGDKGAQAIAQAIDSVLHDMAHNPQHRLREAFDTSLRDVLERLRTDPVYAQKGEQLRHYLLHDENLARYLHDLWARMRSKLQDDLQQPQSWVSHKLTGLGLWLGHSLAQDPQLRASMNERLERWAQGLAPEVSQFIAKHIQDTVQRWDAQELSDLVEQHIGKDLQFIRINGTLVGGAVGAVLFALTQLGH
ncbi:MAG: DUF445 domain-containing protein [Comamonas sp.]|nr:DUF445 domain-containing protein [Candidatus Comamonas equi]